MLLKISYWFLTVVTSHSHIFNKSFDSCAASFFRDTFFLVCQFIDEHSLENVLDRFREVKMQREKVCIVII